MVWLTEIGVNGGGAAEHEEFAVVGFGVRFDAFIDIGQKRSENVFDVLLLQHFFQFDQ